MAIAVRHLEYRTVQSFSFRFEKTSQGFKKTHPNRKENCFGDWSEPDRDSFAFTRRRTFSIPIPPRSSRSDFLEQGFEWASVGQIARRARASKETFYSRYTSKSELFRAVMDRLMNRFTSLLISTLEAEGPPDVVLVCFGNVMLDRILSDEGIGLQKIVYMEAARFPEVAKVFFELGPQRTLKGLAQYFSAQVKKGNMREMDAELASAHFMGLLTSDLMMRKSLGVLTKPTSQEKAYRIKIRSHRLPASVWL